MTTGNDSPARHRNHTFHDEDDGITGSHPTRDPPSLAALHRTPSYQNPPFKPSLNTLNPLPLAYPHALIQSAFESAQLGGLSTPNARTKPPATTEGRYSRRLQ